MEPVTIKQALEYEIRSSWWARHIGNRWLQKKVGNYMYRKTLRKYKRYAESLSYKNQFDNEEL